MLALLACPLEALAEVRVLLAFDASGHRVHDVTRTGSRNANLTSHVEPPADPAAAALAGEAVLAWLAADGRTLVLERVPDPRVGHAPAPGGNDATLSPGTPVGLSEGGWIAHGPDAAVTLVVRLPMVVAPALAAEEWRVALGDDDATGQ